MHQYTLWHWIVSLASFNIYTHLTAGVNDSFFGSTVPSIQYNSEQWTVNSSWVFFETNSRGIWWIYLLDKGSRLLWMTTKTTTNDVVLKNDRALKTAIEVSSKCMYNAWKRPVNKKIAKIYSYKNFTNFTSLHIEWLHWWWQRKFLVNWNDI